MKLSNEELKSVFEEIREEAGGVLRPGLVVELAASTNHPLHEYFEWSDTEAAQKYREDQARRLIRSVKIRYSTNIEVSNGTSKHIVFDEPAYVNRLYDREGHTGYVLSDTKSGQNTLTRESVLRFNQWIDRYTSMLGEDEADLAVKLRDLLNSKLEVIEE